MAANLTKPGLSVKPLSPYDYHLGSFPMAWRDPETGLLSATSDRRRAGNADGF